MDLRKQEKIFFSVRDYQKAEECKRKADRMEKQERVQSEQQLNEVIAKQEKVLR